MSTIIFKILTTEDTKFLLKLYEAVGWTNYLQNSSYIQLMINSSTYIIGAYMGKILVGFIRGFSDSYSINFIQDLLVHPNHQRCGIGQRLIKEIIRKFPNVEKTVLITDNEERQKIFYESCGFKEISETFSLRCFLKMK